MPDIGTPDTKQRTHPQKHTRARGALPLKHATHTHSAKSPSVHADNQQIKWQADCTVFFMCTRTLTDFGSTSWKYSDCDGFGESLLFSVHYLFTRSICACVFVCMCVCVSLLCKWICDKWMSLLLGVWEFVRNLSHPTARGERESEKNMRNTKRITFGVSWESCVGVIMFVS